MTTPEGMSGDPMPDMAESFMNFLGAQDRETAQASAV
jgi:hypothetical protein